MALVFIGFKIFLADLLGLDKLPPAVSLAVTFGILAAGVAWSRRIHGQPAVAHGEPAES